jgi:hypothetical protein
LLPNGLNFLGNRVKLFQTSGIQAVYKGGHDFGITHSQELLELMMRPQQLGFGLGQPWLPEKGFAMSMTL